MLFLLASILVFSALVTAYLHYSSSIKAMADEASRSSTEAANDDVVELISNVMADETRNLITTYEKFGDKLDWNNYPETMDFRLFDQQARRLTLGTRILKIKAYARDGMTVYSTDKSQLGDDYSEREDVIHALRGRPSSEISKRQFFEAFTENISDVAVVSSYHPFKDPNGRIIGVMEVYADRTLEFTRLEQNLLSAKGLSLLYLAGFLFVALGPLAFAIYARHP
jgi:hypothetical protein